MSLKATTVYEYFISACVLACSHNKSLQRGIACKPLTWFVCKFLAESAELEFNWWTKSPSWKGVSVWVEYFLCNLTKYLIYNNYYLNQIYKAFTTLYTLLYRDSIYFFKRPYGPLLYLTHPWVNLCSHPNQANISLFELSHAIIKLK